MVAGLPIHCPPCCGSICSSSYWLSDSAVEEALIEVPTMGCFAGAELISNSIQAATTILTLSHLPEMAPSS